MNAASLLLLILILALSAGLAGRILKRRKRRRNRCEACGAADCRLRDIILQNGRQRKAGRCGNLPAGDRDTASKG